MQRCSSSFNSVLKFRMRGVPIKQHDNMMRELKIFKFQLALTARTILKMQKAQCCSRQGNFLPGI